MRGEAGAGKSSGGVQIGDDPEPGIMGARVGDPVRVCLVSVPTGCPPGDDRGRVYDTTNLRTGATWRLANAGHLCGGA